MPKVKSEKAQASAPVKKAENGAAATKPTPWRPEDKLKVRAPPASRRRRAHRRFLAAQILDAVLAHAKGIDWNALAAEMGRSRSQVRVRCSRHSESPWKSRSLDSWISQVWDQVRRRHGRACIVAPDVCPLAVAQVDAQGPPLALRRHLSRLSRPAAVRAWPAVSTDAALLPALKCDSCHLFVRGSVVAGKLQLQLHQHQGEQSQVRPT